MKLIEKHWSNLEGKRVVILCNPDNIYHDNCSGITLKDSKMLGISLFLTLIKQNWTARLIYHDSNNSENKVHQSIDEVKNQISSILRSDNNPSIVINACLPDKSHKDVLCHDIFEGIETDSKLVYITCWGYNDSKRANSYDIADLELESAALEDSDVCNSNRDSSLI